MIYALATSAALFAAPTHHYYDHHPIYYTQDAQERYYKRQCIDVRLDMVSDILHELKHSCPCAADDLIEEIEVCLEEVRELL